MQWEERLHQDFFGQVQDSPYPYVFTSYPFQISLFTYKFWCTSENQDMQEALRHFIKSQKCPALLCSQLDSGVSLEWYHPQFFAILSYAFLKVLLKAPLRHNGGYHGSMCPVKFLALLVFAGSCLLTVVPRPSDFPIIFSCCSRDIDFQWHQALAVLASGGIVCTKT